MYRRPPSHTLLLSRSQAPLAGRLLRGGGVVVFPTETVYGLGADATDDAAVHRIFEAKGRPADNPLIVHLRDLAQLDEVCKRVPEEARALFRAFSPGPLTVVLPRRSTVSAVVTAGLDTVGVRLPSHPVCRAMLDEAGVAVAAPSANRSGRPSPTDYVSARREMYGRADAILDGGPSEHGLESTVLRMEGHRVSVLREGAVTREMIASVVGWDGLTESEPGAWEAAPPESDTPGSVMSEAAPPEAPARSPGMRHTHYQPGVPVMCAPPARLAEALRDACRRYREPGLLVRRETLRSHRRAPEGRGMEPGGGDTERARDAGNEDRASVPDSSAEPARVVVVQDLEEYGRELYRAFAELVDAGADCIVAEWPEEAGLGRAIRDRLWRASGGHVV